MPTIRGMGVGMRHRSSITTTEREGVSCWEGERWDTGGAGDFVADLQNYQFSINTGVVVVDRVNLGRIQGWFGWFSRTP